MVLSCHVSKYTVDELECFDKIVGDNEIPVKGVFLGSSLCRPTSCYSGTSEVVSVLKL